MTRSRPGAAALPAGTDPGLSSPPAEYRPPGAAISLYLDIGQGAGLAAATGVRPFLPALLAGGLARADGGVDFSGTDWSFLESPGFLLVVLALAALSYGAERSGANHRAAQLALAVVALALGALLFAGSLADGGQEAWPGLIGGVVCAALAWVAVSAILDRARARLQPEAARLVSLYAEGAALALAGIAIFLSPASYLAIAAFLLLLVRGRGERDRKYAGLRVLR
jgi:hypothetical protein